MTEVLYRVPLAIKESSRTHARVQETWAHHEYPFPSSFYISDFYLNIEKETACHISHYQQIMNCQQKATHLTSVTVDSDIFLLVYLPRPCRNLRDLYSLLSRAEQYLLQVMQVSVRQRGTQTHHMNHIQPNNREHDTLGKPNIQEPGEMVRN